MLSANIQSLLSNISQIIAAVGGLGTAAYGLVDTSKALGGGVSNAGFKSIRNGVNRLIGQANIASVFGSADVLGTLRANWLNGMAKADQKMAAKSLMRLCLTPSSAAALAGAVGVDSNDLASVADKISNGTTLVEADINILGRFDAIVTAVLDEAYERADQQYRNWSKFSAAVVAILLAAIGGGIFFAGSNQPFHPIDYLISSDLLVAILIGAVSTPLAPIAKDLSSSIAAAVGAVSALKR